MERKTMSGARPAAGQHVLRGMQVGAAPVRLTRGNTPTGMQQARVAPLPDPREEGLRLGLEQGLREGREQGLRIGREEGIRQGRAEAGVESRAAVETAVAAALVTVQADQARVRAIAQALRDAQREALAAAHDEMIALCYETICRIAGAAAVQPAAVRSQLQQLAVLSGTRESVVLHVHPQDFEWLVRGADEDGAMSQRWQPDPAVALGGCIVKFAGGALDARLETMLQVCRATLLEARARRVAAAGEAESAT
jgi:flagellar assembly protein FliH